MKKTHMVLCALCLAFLLTPAVFASDAELMPEKAAEVSTDELVAPQEEPKEEPAPETSVEPTFEEPLLPIAEPMAWNPPPSSCVQGLACSIPQDCPGGQCFEYNTTHHYRHCICFSP